MDVVCKLLAFLCFVFYGVARIPCVQEAILNWPQTYIRSITVILDNIHERLKLLSQSKYIQVFEQTFL